MAMKNKTEVSAEERKRLQSDYNKAYRAANAASIKAQRAAKYRENGEAICAAKRADYAKDSGKIKARNTAWQKANRKTVSALYAAWCAANPERAKAIGAKYRAANRNKERKRHAAYLANPRNKEKQRVAGLAWRANNPDRSRVIKQNRRARERKDGGRLSPDLPAKLMVLQRGKCPVCRCELNKKNYHLDHIEPIALGGSHDDKNIQLLCKHCNMTKNAKHPIDFMQSRGFLL